MSKDKKTKSNTKSITLEGREADLSSRGYYFMPASIDTMMRGLSVSIKYKRNPNYSARATGNGYLFELPDRTLQISRSFLDSEKRSKAIDADVTLDLDGYLNKSWLGRLGLSFAMVNASAVTNMNTYPDYDKEAAKDWPYIVADSGGFQLAKGTESFLDPQMIVEKQNLICDIGVTLDIPLRPSFQKDLLIRSAKVHGKNNEVFDKYKRPSLHLQNAFHGSTFYARSKYREFTENVETPRCCVAGVRSSDLVPLMLSTIQVMTTGKKYTHYHVLGVSGLERWVALSYLGHKRLAPVLTSDSSTHTQLGVNMQYANPLLLLGISDMRVDSKRYPLSMLPCSCDICYAIRHARVFNERGFTFPYEMVVLHNLIAFKSYTDEIWALTAQPKKEILSFVRPLCNDAKLKTISSALNAIDMAVQDGVDKAAAKYAPWLLEKWPVPPSRGIFSDVGRSDDEHGKKRFKELSETLSRYEKYHKMK